MAKKVTKTAAAVTITLIARNPEGDYKVYLSNETAHNVLRLEWIHKADASDALMVNGQQYPDGRTQKEKLKFNAAEHERFCKAEEERAELRRQRAEVKPVASEGFDEETRTPGPNHPVMGGNDSNDVTPNNTAGSSPEVKKLFKPVAGPSPQSAGAGSSKKVRSNPMPKKVTAAAPAPAATAVAEPPVKAKKPAAKKAAAAPAPAPEAPAASNGKVGAPKKSGLGKPQVKILTALKSGNGMTRAELTAATGINSGFTGLLGHIDPARREPQSLSALGFIRIEEHDVDGKDVIHHVITKTGLKALEKAGE